jgi:hypothetical protein
MRSPRTDITRGSQPLNDAPYKVDQPKKITAIRNVWSAALLQAKSGDKGLVCANVYEKLVEMVMNEEGI